MKLIPAIAAAALLTAMAAPAFAAGELCKPVAGEPKSVESIQKMLEDKGYKVRKMDKEDGCVEMKGTDAEGKRVEVYVHPVTGEIVKVK